MAFHFVYHENQSVPGVDSYSPSAGKPALFMERVCQDSRYEWEHGTAPAHPVTVEQLKLVHDADYVDAVFAGRAHNGFGNTDPRVPEACLWTIGSLVGAVKLAAEQAHTPVCSPSSGFHHAHYGDGGGFCTFNGLMVAAQLYLLDNPGHKVGIIDCDVHYGDGTADILQRKPWLKKRVVHHTSGKHFHEDTDRWEFFAWLEHAIHDVNKQGCDVVIYQAGADMHKADPLGGFLDDEDMALRDRRVFQGVKAGITWNLAGGYRTAGGSCKPVLDTHMRTFAEARRAAQLRKTPLPGVKRATRRATPCGQ
jgi:acetoin utilization deacetylase AcuC-like enzyme